MSSVKGLESKINLDLRLERSASQSSGFSLIVKSDISSSGITAIFGGSGSGKTTLLRCIAGLEKQCEGSVSVNGVMWQGPSFFMPPHERPIGYVFQEASLFTHQTARQNLEYAIKRSGNKSMSERFDLVVETMGIASLLARRPHQLSGGERQRVAIARSLLIDPQLLLMDEPLASLDEDRKHEILPYLEKLKTDFNLPILYVSHSMAEVARLADRALVIESGSVIAEGSLKEVFSRIDKPALATKNTGVVLYGNIVEKDPKWQLSRVHCSGGDLWVSEGDDPLGADVRIQVLARDVSLTRSVHDDSSILNRIPVEVLEIAADDSLAVALVRLKFGDDYLVARVTRKSCHQLQLSVGDRLWAQIKSAAVLR